MLDSRIPKTGLTPIEQAVTAALRDNAAVSVEATGAWDSDWQLALDLEAIPARVLRVWVSAPLEVTLDRLARRASRKAPTTPDAGRWIYDMSRAQAASQQFDSLWTPGCYGSMRYPMHSHR